MFCGYVRMAPDLEFQFEPIAVFDSWEDSQHMHASDNERCDDQIQTFGDARSNEWESNSQRPRAVVQF